MNAYTLALHLFDSAERVSMGDTKLVARYIDDICKLLLNCTEAHTDNAYINDLLRCLNSLMLYGRDCYVDEIKK